MLSIDVIGYFIYYMCLYSFQFVLYLNEDFSAYSVSKVIYLANASL